MDHSGKIFVPWTPAQVLALNAYQKLEYVHPYTGAGGVELVATADGWVETPGGPVVQIWAHDWHGGSEPNPLNALQR